MNTLEQYYEQYTCWRCGGYGDQCMCGPAAHGCTFDVLCAASWHLHECPGEEGCCDRPEAHLPFRGTPSMPPWPPTWPQAPFQVT